MICVPVFGQNKQEVLERLSEAGKEADIAEIRIDLIPQGAVVLKLPLEKTNLPLIATVRPKWEGGSFSQSEEERIQLLKTACDLGYSFIDIEFNSPDTSTKDILKYAKTRNTKVILSYHDFSGTKKAEFYQDLFLKMQQKGPDVIKIVTYAKDELDFLNIAPLYQMAKATNQALIAFCMGQKGKYSRLFCLNLGAFLTFACLDKEASSAPGQLPASKVRSFLKLID